MNSIGQNILEQEDMIKGMPDESLQMEMQMPTGRFPEFLILSEIQRRTDMRQRYASQQDMAMPTIKDQVVADGLATMATQASPVPAAPNSPSPNVPLGDSQQGLAGMGVQTFASGGKTDEINGFPDYSGDGKISRKDVLIGRGVLPMDNGGPFSDRVIDSTLSGAGSVYDFARVDNPFALFQIVGGYLARKGVDLADATREQIQQALSDNQIQADPEPIFQEIRRRRGNIDIPSTEEMISRYEAVEEAGVDPRTGPRSRFDDAAEEVRRIRAERPDLETMSDFEKSLLPLGERLGQEAVETGSAIVRGTEELIDPIGPYTGAAVDELSDFAGVVAPPATSFLEDIIYSNVPQGLRGMRQNIQPEDGLLNLPSLSEVIEGQRGRFGEITINDDIGEFLRDPENIEAFRDKVSGAREFLTEEGPQGERSLLDQFLDKIGATDYVEGLGNLDNVDGKVDTGAGQQTSSTTDNNATRTDDSRATNLIQTPVGTIDVSGIIGSGEPVGYMEQAEEALGGMDATQADVLENMQQLIQQTQDAAKRQAFNVGLMNLAAGIASGKPDLGLGSAATSTAQILGRGETAAAPIRAAAAQQPMTAMKDKIAALTNLARVDVSRQQMEGLNFRSDNALKTAALDAAEAAVKEGLVVFDSAEEMSAAVAQAANDIYLQLRGTYGSTPTISQGMVRDINPDTGRLRYGAESAR